MSLKFSSLYGGRYDNNDMNNMNDMNDNENNNELNYIIKLLLQFRTDIKMYHWQTDIFAYHKISDELLSSIDNLTDKLIEASLGILNTRPKVNNETLILRDVNTELFLNENDRVSISLRNISKIIKYTEIANIRDEILSEIDKTKYLMTFK
jgi:DNA-binding ferritin-like protein